MAETPDFTFSDSEANVDPTSDVPALNEALGTLQDELLRLKSAAEYIEQSKEAAREAVASAQRAGEAAASLAGPTQTLVDRLDKVDFPSRLDKIDATVGALQTGFQNVQGRLDGLERNLKDDLRGLEGAIGRLHQASETAAKDHIQAIKQIRLLGFVTLAGLIVIVGLLFFR